MLKLSGLLKLFIFSILLFGCKKETNYLDSFFNRLEKNSPLLLITEFKKSPLDSVVIKNSDYDAIFVDAANALLRDSVESTIFTEYFKRQNIDLVGRQDKWTVIAAFHKYLNKEKYEIEDLWNEMVDLSNKEYDKQYGELSQEKEE